MKKALFAIALLILKTSILSFAEEPQIDKQNVLSEFSKDLAELQSMSLQFTALPASISNLQKLSAPEKRQIDELMQKAVDLARKIFEKYKNSPVKVSGFSIGFPLGITIDFEIDTEKL